MDMIRRESTHWKILQLLKENFGAFVSGNHLASLFELSRTGIWKHIQNLKSMGYEILSHPKDGYQLVKVPDSLIVEEIGPDLHTSWLALHYHHFEQIGSTNDYAMQLAIEGAPHGTLVVAEEQTRGKGRLQRPWLSSARRGIYMSLILSTPLPLNEAQHATTVAAITLADLLRSQYRVPAKIKWPNDILVDEKKVAGILTEMQSDQDYARFLVVGIGINVNHERGDLAGPFRYPATSIAIELGHPVERKELLVAFLRRFETRYELFTEEGFAAFLPQLEGLSAVLGKRIKVLSGKKEIAGKALGFTQEGGLRIQTDGGREEVVWVGDVTQLGDSAQSLNAKGG